MKVANVISVFLLVFLIIGFTACNEEDDNGGSTNPPAVTPAPPTPTPEPAPCPCENGCCDSSNQCKSGEHCITVPLSGSSQAPSGMECTYEVKGIECMDCCNLNAVKLRGQGAPPIRENSTLERSNSTKNVGPENIGFVSGSWESSWDTTFGCQGNPIGCGNGSYTAVLTFERGCPETVDLCFRLP